MRVLIVGGSGLIGSHLMKEAARLGHEAFGTFRTFPLEGLVPLDLRDGVATGHLLDRLAPDWVVHAAGWSWVDGCEKDQARAMDENCYQPARLARACRTRNMSFAYFSTTYVFDGQAGPYREYDSPRPINAYGRSKLAGEQAILEASDGEAMILRIICPWGQEPQRKNFVYQVLRAVASGQPMRIPSDQRGNPTYAPDIAAWCLAMLAMGKANIWHLGSPWPDMTRAEWVERILIGLRRDPRWSEAAKAWKYEALPTVRLGQAAPRPLHAGACSQREPLMAALAPREPSDIGPLLSEFKG